MLGRSFFRKGETVQDSESVEVEQEVDPSVQEDHVPESEERAVRGGFLHKFILWTQSILSGDVLSKSEVTKHYPYVVFLLVLALLYITHIFSVQELYREHSRLTREIKDLRSKSLTISSYRMHATRHSNIIKELQDRGSKLEESLTPNIVITK